jgi:hypothetical protein
MGMYSRGSIGLSLLAAALMMAACSKSSSDGENARKVRQSRERTMKYVVEVDTPSGVVSGFSVFHIRTVCDYTLNGYTCGSTEQSEAVPVRLPNGKILYSLLTRNQSVQYVTLGKVTRWDNVASGNHKEFLKTDYPDMVMFGDDRDPKSVYEVDPSNIENGSYSVKRVYIEDTRLPVSDRILRILPWVDGIGPLSGMDKVSAAMPFSAEISGGSFKRSI